MDRRLYREKGPQKNSSSHLWYLLRVGPMHVYQKSEGQIKYTYVVFGLIISIAVVLSNFINLEYMYAI